MKYPQYRGTGTRCAQCAKIQYRTRTRVTRFGNTAGITVPMQNPICGFVFLLFCMATSHTSKFSKTLKWSEIQYYCYSLVVRFTLDVMEYIGVCQARYLIYYLPIWVIPLHVFNIGCVIHVQDPFFDVNSTVISIW